MTLPLDEVKVVDADTHMTERHDLWTSARRRSSRIGSRTSTRVDGAGDVGRRERRGARSGRRRRRRRQGRHKGRSFEGLYEWEIEQHPRRAYDPVARMELLDEIGIWAQIIFPGVVGLGGQTSATSFRT